MCTAIFTVRLFSVLLVASIVDGLQPDKPEGHKITVRWPEIKSNDPDQKMDGKLWTPEISFHLLSLVERMNEKMVLQETQMTTLQRTMEQTEQRVERNFNDKLEREIGFLREAMKDKLEREIGSLRESMKDKSREICPSDVSMLGVGQELHNFGNFVVDGIKERLEKLTTNFDTDKKELVSHIRNVTVGLEDRITEAADTLDRVRNEAVDTLDRVSNEMSGSVNKTLVNIREGIEGGAREIIQELKNMTGPLIEQIEDNEKLSAKLDDQFDNLNNSLSLGFDGVNSMVGYYGKIIVRGEQTLESCKKGMQKRSTLHPYPYPVVYSDVGSINEKKFLCDASTLGGGWIIIQYRSKGDTDFYRGWEDYKRGFGSLDTDFWIGLDTIYRLTYSATYELRIELKYNGKSKFAHYSTFRIGSEGENYRLSLGSYDGTAGDSLRSRHNGKKFTTKDRDNDNWSNGNCAVDRLGAWWYDDCHFSNLNGKWGVGDNKGPRWDAFTGVNPATFTEMKIRRV